jgi:hypothetical protein
MVTPSRVMGGPADSGRQGKAEKADGKCVLARDELDEQDEDADRGGVG